MIGDLDLYRQQHQELLGVLGRLEESTGHAPVSTSAMAEVARCLLAALSGKLMVHLRMEELSLYPALLRSPDPEVRAGAARFRREVGALRQEAERLSRHWLRPAAIEREPDAFKAELLPLLRTLATRIATEDVELIPLAERLDDQRA